MKEQLVSFEVAILAKELGFSETCSYMYKVEEGEEPVLLPSSTNAIGGFFSTYQVPTQSLLQKWLREVFKVLVNVAPIDAWDCWGYTLLGEDAMQPFRKLDLQYNEYPTYEEALEAGLLEALKILKEEK